MDRFEAGFGGNADQHLGILDAQCKRPSVPLHRDPADRFLAATAYTLDITIVTADEKLFGLGTIQTLANR